MTNFQFSPTNRSDLVLKRLRDYSSSRDKEINKRMRRAAGHLFRSPTSKSDLVFEIVSDYIANEFGGF